MKEDVCVLLLLLCYSIEDIDDLNGSDCMHMLTIKTSNWSAEKEWRTFFPPNPPKHKEQLPSAKVVFLGARIEAKHEKDLRKICTEKGILLLKMIPEFSQHKLVAQPLGF